jgi:hypothetical protein
MGKRFVSKKRHKSASIYDKTQNQLIINGLLWLGKGSEINIRK